VCHSAILPSETPDCRSHYSAFGLWCVSAARLALAALAMILLGRSSFATDPNTPVVREAIDRAVGYLRDNVQAVKPYEAGIVTYALIRSGESVESPAVKTLVRLVLDEKLKGPYGNNPHQFYEAGTDMMMFEAVNPRRYQRELEIIASFTVENQWPSGSWYYYTQPEHGGDTSHSQYAILGLWAASRAGVRIPRNVWSRAADWHLKTQVSDGGFAYHPGDGKISTHSMTVNGVASLCIVRLMLYPGQSYPPAFAPVSDDAEEKETKAIREDAKPAAPKGGAPARPGVLQPLDLSGSRTAGRSRRSRIVGVAGPVKTIPLWRLNQAISRGANWIRTNYKSETGRFHLYYLYGLERMCALAEIDSFDGHDWYGENALATIKKQRRDGHFDGDTGLNPDTAFALLFLSKATSKLMGRHVEDPRFGGGLMIGGRGLPSNLGAIQTSGEGIKVRKLDAPVDKLLSELENPKSAEVESVQQAIVDTVQIGDREKLIGQKDRLKKLAHDRRPEVRRTAIWALGRCATVHDALVLVKALDDSEINVVIEANNALCWLSRRPNGFGRSADPVADLAESATERQRHDAVQSWRAQVRKDWREWFDQVAPYSQRDLPFDLP
jgi:hypothetical protein